MKKTLFLKRLPQALSAVTAAVCAFVMTSVGYYRETLPDEYTSAYGNNLRLDTLFPITAEESKESLSAAAELADSDGDNLQIKHLSLKLFGSVPIKEVDEETVDRPLLAAGGQAFGIKLVTDGVMIIELKKISGECPAEDAGLEVGDVIEAIDGERVSTNERVGEIIKASGGENVTVKYRRDEKSHTCTLTPVFSEGSYRAGMWVRDSSAGIGTMTFIDPETMAFAGLGHPICDSDTHEALPLSNGSISDVTINGITKSKKGEPGQLLGEFSGESTGSLTLNCDNGVFGKVDSLPDGAVIYPLGFSQEVHTGKAYIIAQTNNGEPQKYEISIEKISLSGDADSEDFGHDMIIKVTDKKLIKSAGGIVQPKVPAAVVLKIKFFSF